MRASLRLRFTHHIPRLCPLSSVLCLLTSAFLASAQTWITNSLTLSETNTAYDGADLIIDGAVTVTIDGPHAFNSLLLTNHGVLTHSPRAGSATHKLDLTFAGAVIVSTDSKIDVSELGYGRGGTSPGGAVLPATGTSGGSYGGRGGGGDAGTAGQVYGDYADPGEWGSGSGYGGGGGGGGLVRVRAQTLHLDGNILADGGWGGSGGGVWVQVERLEGQGAMRARGGNGGFTGWPEYRVTGAGGGGRIAVYAGDWASFDLGHISAPGGSIDGNGGGSGGPGTVFILKGVTHTHARFTKPGMIAVFPTNYFTLAIPELTNGVSIQFSQPIDPNSFAPDTLLIQGPLGTVTPMGISEIGDRLYHVDFPPQTENGYFQFTLSPTLLDADGYELDQNANGIPGEPDDAYTFTLILDTVPPRVAHHEPAGDIAGTLSSVDVWFSEAMDSATVVPSAFIFTNPSGQAIAINSVQELGLNRWRLRFSGQTTTGLYTVAYKDSLTDLAGNPLDLAHSTSAAFNLVAVDLELGSVSVSTNQLWAGDPITISWTGRNATGAPLLGAWTDAVYLSRDGNWDIGDIRLGTVTHSGGLAENETYSASVAVNVPGVLPGDYYLLVRGDIANTERETGEANNLVAYGPVPLDVPGLTPNGPAHTGTLTPGNRAQYYAITLAPGESLRLNLTGTAASGANELHVSLGAIPTRQQADFSAKGGGQNQQIVLTGAPGGATYYVLVYGDQLDAAGNPFALTAETGALFVTSIAPRRHGNISPATVTITGAGFDETTGVQFVPTNGPVRVPVGIEVVSSSTLRANLDLTNWLAGFYTVRVTKGTNAVELANAFQVIEGGYSHLVTRLIVPSAVGFNIPIRQTIWIEYANDGDAPMPVPLLVLRGDHGARMTADPALAVPRAGFGVIDGLSDTVQLLAFGDPSTPWLLQPGESRRMPVYYLGLAEKSHYPTVTFTLDAITSSDTRPLDPTGTGEPFRVSGLNNERWAAFAPLFQQVTGPTWGSYITALSQQVSDMSVFGLQPDSLQGVWNAIRLSFIPDWARNLLIDIPAKHLALVPPPAPPSDCHPQWDMYIDYLIKWDQANQAYEHAQNVQDEFQFAVAGNVGEALSRTVLIAAELRLFTFILPELQEAYAAAGMEANFQKLKTGVTVAYYSAKLVVAAIESGGDLNDMVAKVNALSKVYRQLMEQARADQQAFDNLVANLPASSPLLTVYLKALGWIAKALSWVSYIDSIERIFTDIPRTHQALVNALAAYDNESPPGAYQRAKAALDALKAMPECPPSEEDPSVKAGPFGPGEGKDYSTVDMSLVAVAPSGDLSHVVIELIAVNCPVEIDWPAVTVTVNDELVPVSGTTDEWNIGQEGKDGIMVPSKWLFGLPHCDVGCKPVIWSFRVTAYTTSGRSGSGIFNYSYAPDNVDPCQCDPCKCKKCGDPPLPPPCIINCGGGGGGSSTAVNSFDPNDKLGPAGYGEQGFVTPDGSLSYQIRFENKADASAPARLVLVTDALDPNLDLATFELTEISFAGLTLPLPSGLKAYQDLVPLTLNGNPLYADVQAWLDYDARTFNLTLSALDPLTGWYPEDPLVGLLYPNDSSGRGEGSVSFRIFAKAGLPTGTVITNRATIVFDYNAPIDTPQVLNTLDSGAPSSAVNVLPPASVNPVIVSWTGADDASGAGIESHDVYVSDNGGPWQVLVSQTAATSIQLTGEQGHTYAFFSVARDFVGNTEPPPLVADTLTVINQPPIALDDAMDCDADGTARIRIAKLLANDSDPGGDPLALTAVDPTSAQGGSVGSDSEFVSYTAPSGYEGADSFHYFITDGRGAFASALVNVTVGGGQSQSPNIVSIEPVSGGRIRITFVGIPNRTYGIQETDSLTNSSWQRVASQTAGANGVYTFEDAVAEGANRFYRAVWP